jgi:hypothetical protein
MLLESSMRYGLGLLLFGVGCNNPCQQICLNMADYAAECSLEVTSDDLKACNESFAKPTDEQITHCQEWNDPEQLREWWTCDDVADNFLQGSE